MNKSCYCCDRRTPVDAGAAAKEKSRANLNIALRELEVLNVGLDKVRLPGFPAASKIIMRPNVPNAISPKRIQGGFCVLQMNKRFVTNFVTSSMVFGQKHDEPSAAGAATRNHFCERKMVRPSGGALGCSKSASFDQDPVSCNKEPVYSSLKVRTSRTRFRFQKPYEMPWLRKLEERVRAYNWNREKSAAVSAAADETSSTESNGCKSGSNPSTPSKSASGSGLMRSRSLDNIASKRWTDVEDIVVVLESKDIENVAQKMKDLQVM